MLTEAVLPLAGILEEMPKRKNAAAVALAGRRMTKMTKAQRAAVAQSGGAARAQKLSADERRAIARAAAKARWGAK